MFRTTSFYSTFLGCLLLALLSPLAHGALIATEDFESYTPNSSLNLGAGGAGWSSNWAAASGATVQAGVIPGFGNAMQIGLTGTDDNLAERQWSSGQTGTVYVGFLLRKSSVETDDFLQVFFNNTTGETSNSSVSGGLRNDGVIGQPDTNYLFARVNGNANSQNTTFALANDTTISVVMKFQNTAAHDPNYDRTDLFINQTTEGTADATVSNVNSGTSSLSYVHFRAFEFESDDRVFIDEIKVATTYAEAITVVPEPSTLTLAALGVLGLGFYGWRRRSRQ